MQNWIPAIQRLEGEHVYQPIMTNLMIQKSSVQVSGTMDGVRGGHLYQDEDQGAFCPSHSLISGQMVRSSNVRYVLKRLDKSVTT